MDNWFLELFSIINRQSEERKVEMLLPELYSEFDILARNFNSESLKELYQFINTNNPIHTTDKEYNLSAHESLKRNLLKRMVMIDDLTIIEQELLNLITNRKRKASKEYVESWKDYIFVYERLQELLSASYSSPKPTKKIVEPAIEETVIEETIVEETFNDDTEIIEEVTEVIPERVIVEETKEEIVIEEEAPEPIVELEPEPTIAEPEPVVKEEPKVIEQEFVVEEEPKVIDEEPIIEEPKKVIKEVSKPIEESPKKTVPSKPVISQIVKKQNPIERKDNLNDPNLFFDFLDVVTDNYPIIINIEALRKLSNPKPSFFRMFVSFIDEDERDETFFIKLINYLFEYNLYDLVTYIADKSIRLRKLCTFNIGLLNTSNISKKIELILLLTDENEDYIKNSLLEKEIRVYIDNLSVADDITDVLYQHCESVSLMAPKQIDTSTAIDAVAYYKNHVLNTHTPVINDSNPTHLYWAMVLSACQCIYVARDKDYEFTQAMDFVSKTAVKLIKAVEDENQGINMQKLAIDYVRRIYKAGEKSPEYGKWWDRQRDDFFEQKISAVQYIRSSN